MIKVISNSDSLSTWYLDPGVTSGDGTTKEAPIVWSEEATENGTKLTYPIKQNSGLYESRVYILVTLKAGTNYSFYLNANWGPMNGELFKQTDLNTVIGNYYYSSTNTINVSEDGNYILGIWQSYSYDVTDYLTLTPAPETTVGEAGWKKKEGLVQGDGWNKKTGKVFEYRTLEKANLKHNVFLQGLMYFDTNDFYSFSSPDVKNQTFKNGPIIVQRNLNLGDSEPTLLSGYSDYFCEKRKGYIYIAEAGSYTFSGQADDHGMLKLEDNEAYISWSGTKTYFTVNLEVGYHLIEYYHGEGGGGQITEVYWTTPSNSTATSIPAEVFFYSPKEYKELGGI